MAAVHNASATSPLLGTVWARQPPDVPPPAWRQDAGSLGAYGNPDNSPACFYFFASPAVIGTPAQPFWTGYLRVNDVVDVVPETGAVTLRAAPARILTQADLDAFKKLFPEDATLQALTLAQLNEYANDKDFDGGTAQSLPGGPVKRDLLTECQWAAAGLAVDCVFVLTGALGLHGKVNAASLQRVAAVVAPVMNELEHAASILATPGATLWQQAMALKDLAHVFWSGGLFEPIYKAIMSSLTWWDMALYGALGMTTVAAAFLTEGAALVAMFAAELVQVGFVVSDAVKVGQNC